MCAYVCKYACVYVNVCLQSFNSVCICGIYVNALAFIDFFKFANTLRGLLTADHLYVQINFTLCQHMCAYVHKWHLCVHSVAVNVCLLGSFKFPLAGGISHHPSARCVVIAPYILPHIIQMGQLQLWLAGPAQAPYVKWNISRNYICVSFSSILPHILHPQPPSTPTQPPTSILSSATRQIKEPFYHDPNERGSFVAVIYL